MLGVSICILVLAIWNAKISSGLHNKRDGFESYTVQYPLCYCPDLFSLAIRFCMVYSYLV